jgi:Zn-finger nucleic acid-binding protein
MLPCPRDRSNLVLERKHGIEVDHCPTCQGFWLDAPELEDLEARKADEDTRRGMIEYSQRPSELPCPICGKEMTAFNYRAHALEIDACEEHGYWLDHTEDKQLFDVLEHRIQGLRRIPAAEAAWHNTRTGAGGGGFMDRIKGFFGGGRR